MSEYTEIIRKDSDGGICFGNYTLPEKTKVSDYEINGDLYKVKTFYEITKLEKNGLFLYESVPGTTVTGLKENANEISFHVSGKGDVQITLGLCENTEYELTIDRATTGTMKTNISGKLNISVDLTEGTEAEVRAVKLS